MKRFNTTGTCYPDEHYMVNLDSRLKQIKKLVDNGDYFVINRARQYGKTTTLRALKEYLKEEYLVVSLSFQGLSSSNFENEEAFSVAFVDMFIENIYINDIAGLDIKIIEEIEADIKNKGKEFNMRDLFKNVKKLCATSQKPIVMMIDEVDAASNNQVFIDFLAQLRNLYLNRKDVFTFHSVILAGVYDIKNLKLKIRPDEQHKYNSPWNIAVKFNIEMSFSIRDIKGMLDEYEKDNKTEMDTEEIAGLIYDYTSGYPFLVSRICQIIDEELLGEKIKIKEELWTEKGVKEAVKIILKEENTLFQDMMKKIEDYSELKELLKNILFEGIAYTFNQYNYPINIGKMFGFIKDNNDSIQISNRIFETFLYNFFIGEEMIKNTIYNKAVLDKNQFIQDGYLNMELVLEKFITHFNDIYGDNDIKFLEENARKFFLLYLKPIINGVGNYYIEARTRDMKRTDIVIDYLGKQYVIEMKIWHGEEYNKRGEQQLTDYLNFYHLDKGYLLSFCFKKTKQIGMKEIRIGEKVIIEAIV